jgi:hypothetical protein
MLLTGSPTFACWYQERQKRRRRKRRRKKKKKRRRRRRRRRRKRKRRRRQVVLSVIACGFAGLLVECTFLCSPSEWQIAKKSEKR